MASDNDDLQAAKSKAKSWFEDLRDQICSAFEGLEDTLPGTMPFADQDAGRFQKRRGSGRIKPPARMAAAGS